MKLSNYWELREELRWEILEEVSERMNDSGAINYQICIEKNRSNKYFNHVIKLNDDGFTNILCHKNGGEVLTFAYAVTLGIFSSQEIDDHYIEIHNRQTSKVLC